MSTEERARLMEDDFWGWGIAMDSTVADKSRMTVNGVPLLDIFTTALRSVRDEERERCLAWVQHAREEGESDMRQVRYWIECGDHPAIRGGDEDE